MNIQSFSKRVGVSPHTIRYYEKAGLFLSIQRLANGHRYFTEKDVRWMEFLIRLKCTGMPIEQMRLYAELRAQGKETVKERQKILESHAEQLMKNIKLQQHHLEKLNHKIDLYRTDQVD